MVAADMPGRSIVAIDWSGDQRNGRHKIWAAEVRDGMLFRLENGRDQAAIGDLLIELAAGWPRLVVGLDFAFSFPAWFIREHSASTAQEGWKLARERGDEWLACASGPFWGRPGKRRPEAPSHYRLTEQDQTAVRGIRPKSIFQVGGAGAVGTGSLRGMALLERLQREGFHIWPFDAPGWPLVLEIYPRLLTGPVSKRNHEARRAYLEVRFPTLHPAFSQLAASSEDAFDAAVSALVMGGHALELDRLPLLQDRQTLLEGYIWRPADEGDAR